jgi:hypothetical protein
LAWFRRLYDFETAACDQFAAEGPAQELLRSWLSLGQREQYDARGFFEVVGSDTGKRYRIYRGHVFNIQELDADGEEAFAWCLTVDGFATGDVNLAQKIALEKFERKALAIANRSSTSTWRQPVHLPTSGARLSRRGQT